MRDLETQHKPVREVDDKGGTQISHERERQHRRQSGTEQPAFNVCMHRVHLVKPLQVAYARLPFR
jgi:hypothetical protein